MIDVKEVRGHYEIYIDGVFYCTCDNDVELEEEKHNIESGCILV